MQDDDLFEVIPPALDADPWDHPPTLKLRTDLLDRLRGSVPGNPVVCPSADPAGPSRTRGVRHGRRGKAEICPRAQYVGYTATPFANVFVDPTTNATCFPPTSSSRCTDRPATWESRSSPRGRATGPVGVGESCWGVGRRPRAFLWLAQTRRRARLDGNPCPSKGFRPHSFPFSALVTFPWVNLRATALGSRACV